MADVAFDPTATLQYIEQYANTTGYFTAVQIGEPKGAIEFDMAASIFMEAISVVETTLVSPIELHSVTFRVYRNMLAEPISEAETQVSTAVSEFLKSVFANFTLGSTTRCVDVAGQYGSGVGATWGYIDVSGVMHRVCDIALPVIVDESSSEFTA